MDLSALQVGARNLNWPRRAIQIPSSPNPPGFSMSLPIAPGISRIMPADDQSVVRVISRGSSGSTRSPSVLSSAPERNASCNAAGSYLVKFMADTKFVQPESLAYQQAVSAGQNMNTMMQQ